MDGGLGKKVKRKEKKVKGKETKGERLEIGKRRWRK